MKENTLKIADPVVVRTPAWVLRIHGLLGGNQIYLKYSPISKAFFTRHGVLKYTHSRADLRISKDSLVLNHVLTVLRSYPTYCNSADQILRDLRN